VFDDVQEEQDEDGNPLPRQKPVGSEVPRQAIREFVNNSESRFVLYSPRLSAFSTKLIIN